MKQMDAVKNEELVKAWCKKMAPPLVTLLSAEPEVQYVALRNISLIVQKRPAVLAHEVKVRYPRQQRPAAGRSCILLGGACGVRLGGVGQRCAQLGNPLQRVCTCSRLH
jgi:hypothetical protein